MRYDVVVVGAGSAGAVLAARSSEDPDRRVLLLEAGPDHSAVDTPAALRTSSFFDAMAVEGRTWPDLLARRTPEQGLRVYERGRGVGGSSAVNAMIAVPGLPEDYDHWARLGAEGWDWATLGPWFTRTALALNLAPMHERGLVSRALLTALPGSASAVPLTRDGAGLRRSTNDCYLEPARERENLEIRGDALVDRVLVDGRRAVGVRLADGTEVEAAEVVVSAGAIHSPAILLRSGLDTEGIGEGLKDHPAFPVPIVLHEALQWDPAGLAVSVLGRLTSGEAPADLQVLALDHLGPSAPHVGMVMVALMQVRSTGRVRIVTDDPTVPPEVDLGLLSDETDARRLAVGVERLLRVLDHRAFRELGTAQPPPCDDAGIRANLGDYVHASGTCAIGRVLDPACRVVGYEGLRVCDAGAMPDLPRANPHLTVVVMAEHLAARMRAGG